MRLNLFFLDGEVGTGKWAHLVPNVFPSSSQCVQITLQCFHKLFPSSSHFVPQCVPNAIHMEFHKLCPKLYSQNLYRWAEGTHLLYFYFGSGKFHLGYFHKFHLILFLFSVMSKSIKRLSFSMQLATN